MTTTREVDGVTDPYISEDFTRGAEYVPEEDAVRYCFLDCYRLRRVVWITREDAKAILAQFPEEASDV